MYSIYKNEKLKEFGFKLGPGNNFEPDWLLLGRRELKCRMGKPTQ